MCTYDDANVCSVHAGLLDGRCLGRRCRVSLQYPGALCGGCVCQTCKKIVVLHLYHVLACAVKFLFTVMQVAFKSYHI